MLCQKFQVLSILYLFMKVSLSPGKNPLWLTGFKLKHQLTLTLFNSSLATGKVLKQWKHAPVQLIFMTGDMRQAANPFL